MATSEGSEAAAAATAVVGDATTVTKVTDSAAAVGVKSEEEDLRRCLAIQSHVVSGYVGNKSALFPLMLHGFDVCPLNSVQFSNHTGYAGGVKGQILDGTQLKDLIDGLDTNGLLFMSHVLTGYIGSVSFLRIIVEIVKRLKAVNPDCHYICDPVLGDNGKLYVAPELIPVYRTEVVPLATILTPNQFECEQLTDMKIVDAASACAALDDLHLKGVETVLLTSTDLPPDQTTVMQVIGSTPWDHVSDNLALWGGERGAGEYARFIITIPRIDFHFTGTGDLTTALLLAWTHQLPHAFATAVENTIASVQAVCTRTAAGVDAAGSIASRELRLVQSKKDLEQSPVLYHAEALRV